MRQTGYNMETIKKQNRSSVLRLINSEGPISKKDIAARLSLTPAAVTLICGEFMESGLLRERGIDEGEEVRAGRKKILIDIDPDFCFLYSINIDSERTTAALCNLKGEAKAAVQIPTDRKAVPGEFLRRAADACGALAAETGIAGERIAGIGVGIPGIVEKETGKSIHAYGVWEQPVEVREILQGFLGLPVQVENNVNAFAMAEILFGRGKKDDDILLIKWGPGVGSAIIIDGKIYEGRSGKAAELGHFIVEKDGELCTCGRRGCLETKVSRQALGTEVTESAVDIFARTIVNCATLLAPNRVVLYGNLFADETLRRRLVEACARYDAGYGEKRIRYSALAGREDYIGPAAFFISQNIF